MGLELKIKETEGVSNSVTIDNDTQNYTANNLTGFGTPNPDRADLKLFLRVFHVDKDGVEAAIDPVPFDSTTVEFFILSTISDGWKKYYFIGVDITGGVPSDMDVNAYLDGIIAGAGLDTLTNESVVDISGTDYTLYITKTEKFPIPQARMDKIEAMENIELLCEECIAERADARAYYDLLKGLLISAVYNFDKGNKTRAQTIIEKANETGEQLYEES